MNQRFHVFVIRLFIFTLIISIISFIAFYYLPASYYTAAFPFLLVFFAAVTLIVHKIILNALDKKPSKFVNYFMLTTFIKLFFFHAGRTEICTASTNCFIWFRICASKLTGWTDINTATAKTTFFRFNIKWCSETSVFTPSTESYSLCHHLFFTHSYT